MIFKRRFSAALLVLLCSTFAATERGGDVKLDSDDLQVVYSDPPEAVASTPSRHLYTKEIAQCSPGESKMMLTLLLQSLKWSDVGERKQEKAIKKMSRFFLVPVKYIRHDDISTTEMLEMLKHSINKSNNLLNTKDAVGRIEFMIGCGDKLFASSKSVAHKVDDYVKLGMMEELSGLPIQWWNIWTKHVKSRLPRTRRQVEGSGNADEEDDYEEEYTDEQIEDDEDEDVNNNDDQSPTSAVNANQVSTAANDYEERKSIEESNYDDEYDDDDENFIDPTQRPSSIATTARAPTTIKEDRRTPLPLIPTLPNEDEDDEDDEDNELDEDLLAQISTSTQAPTTQTPPPITTIAATTTITTTTEQTTTVVSTTQSAATEVTSESSEVTSDGSDYDDNEPPRVVKRIKKIQATAGKTFIYNLEGPIFEDKEGKTNLRLEMLDKNDEPLPSSSWIRFDAAKQEIYGLPLEKDVSRHEFKLRATDKDGAYVDEDVDVTVQQHKSFRSVNHEIFIKVSLEKQFESDVDWKIRLMRGINAVLGDNSLGNIYVRDVTPHKYEDTRYTFSYTNDSLPKEHCPKAELDDLMLKLTKQALNSEMRREIAVHNIEKELINSCAKVKTPRPPSLPPSRTNFPPTVRNHVDKIEAHVGQLLVFAVPEDTFYDPEDQNDLKLSLLYENRSLLEPSNWLQFDPKNQEFYGVPTIYDKTQTYVLVAEDKNGLTTNDALVVEIQNPHSKRDFSVTFEYQLDIGYEQFKSAATKRKFIERIQLLFGDADASAILIKSVKELKHYGRTSVVVQNTTLTHRICPINLIDSLRTRLVRTDGNLRDEVKQAIGSEFNVLKISIVPTSKCSGGDTYHHPDETSPVDRPEEHESPLLNQEVLITYVLPTAIILLMLLIALLIACLLYKRRNTGKMELGDEEERKSFRSKGIPVIFQDELDEKPEIITKSPVILKDEKPPLLPQYNGLNQDGDEDVDQYIPPQPLLMGSRDSRGKSPVSQNTPSYRKPPPYVSP